MSSFPTHISISALVRLLCLAVVFFCLTGQARAGEQGISPSALQDQAAFQVALFEDRFEDPALNGASNSPARNADRAAADQSANGSGQPRNRAEAGRGFLSGSFIGALLFGYPFQSIGTADLLLLALIGFAAYRVFANKSGRGGPGSGQRDEDAFSGRGPENPGGKRLPGPWTRDRNNRPSDTGDGDTDPPESPWPRNRENEPGMRTHARAMWDRMRSEAGDRRIAAPAKTGSGGSGFDEDDFLAGARTLYVKLQEAWAARKPDQLEPFITAELMQGLREQAEADPEPGQVQILLLTASLSDVSTVGDRETASVIFDAVIHDGPEGQGEPESVRELWRFSRQVSSEGSWRLEGIEQV